MSFYEICICFAVLFEGVIAWRYFETLFEKKYMSKVILPLISLGYFLHLLAYNVVSPINNALLFTFVNFLLMRFLYRTSNFKSLFHAVILVIFVTGSELVALFLLGLIWENISTYSTNIIFGLLFVILSKFFYLIFAQVAMKVFFGKKDNSNSNKFLWLLWASPVITILIYLLFCAIIISEITMPEIINFAIVVLSFLLLFSNVFIFIFYQKNQELNQKYTEIVIQMQKDIDTDKFYKSLDEQNRKQAILIHDIHNHLTVIRDMSSDKNGIEKYINEIQNSDALKIEVEFCENHTLNLILGRYHQLFKNANISSSFHVASKSLEFIASSDITSLFANLFENAFEATQNLHNSFVDFRVKVDSRTSNTMITLVNSCETAPIKSFSGKFLTTKKDTIHHGYGINSIISIIEKYDGIYNFYVDETDNTFHSVIEFQTRKLF